MIAGLLVAAVTAAVLFAADWLAETDIRRRQRNIRDTKRRLCDAQAELRRLAHERRLERGRREFLRRKALIAYRKAQRDLLQIGKSALDDAKRAAFTKLRVVEDRVHNRSGLPRSFIDEKLFARFHELKSQVHAAIAESKTLTTFISKRLKTVQRELEALRDGSTHRRAGGKKKIEQLLAQLHADGRHLLASRGARGSTLRLGDRAYVLEQPCGGCRARLSPAMAYCPSCGEAQEGVKFQKHLKRDAGDDAHCPECFAPTTPELSYCFNCGEKQDPFGLRSAL